MKLRRILLTVSLVAAWCALTLSVQAQPPGRQPGERGRQPEPPRMPVMTAIDTDGDGALSDAEIAAAAGALKKLDRNGDGQLSREELRPEFGGPGRPEGPRGGGPGGRGPGGPGPQAGQASGTMRSETLPVDDVERKVLQAMRQISEEQGRRMNVPEADGRLLRVLAEAIGAKQVVEFGTSNGISAIWLSLALRKTGGKMLTHEIDPDTATLARKNFERAGVTEYVTVVEGDGHAKAKELKGPIDLVFIDADKEGYLDYFQKTLPLVRPGGLILAHNMNPRMADAAFLKAITTSPDVDTLFYMDGGGMSVTLKKR